ncbi:multiple sugar transport system permease protein/arabinosaccharide transport system permease protein [Kribbella sp. VKM Ac-2527]|jgi:multiple sugar transport system permease protein|uniref:Multiple sugar transport system permease protein/arabinosaccharide transport system permease protein n=1 Tax=Kribbella caucasensis TaxID=2512215 RepID=A0A4R6J5R2_9ACTN|nr:carbohydrate ABC transporter permease [Kribbella sp. VKM Ac-2527]TDO29676.1 multiple sugar transport system permease protein/arabinosaccharide transport system permease protein [Kribbella sp. VKM Ac-2527]
MSASTTTGSQRLRTFVVYAGMAVLLAVFLYPLWWMASSSFKPGSEIVTSPLSFDPRDFTLDHYRAMFASVPIWTGFLNTAIMLVLKGGITLVFCPLAGFAFAKYNFPGKNFLFGFILLTLMLPTLVLVIPLLLEMSLLNWVNTYQGLVLPGAIDAFSIFWMRQVIAGIPDELLEAGRLDGCSALGLYRRIVLPVIRPGLAALAVLTFLNIYNDFLWPVIVVNDASKQTLQVVLSNLSLSIASAQVDSSPATVWGQLLAATTVASIPVVIIFVLLQRHFVRGILAGSTK